MITTTNDHYERMIKAAELLLSEDDSEVTCDTK